jgi:hypothetical protein
MRDDSCEAMDNTDVREIERLHHFCICESTVNYLMVTNSA